MTSEDIKHQLIIIIIVGVAGVALGSVAAAAPQVPVVAAAQAVADADSDVHIGGAVGKAVPVVGLAGGASGRRGSCCPDLTALAQLGLSLRVQLGKRKTCTSRKRSDRPFTEWWTLSVRMPGSTFPCRQHCQSVEKRMKWTCCWRYHNFVSIRNPNPTLSAAVRDETRSLTAWPLHHWAHRPR